MTQRAVLVILLLWPQFTQLQNGLVRMRHDFPNFQLPAACLILAVAHGSPIPSVVMHLILFNVAHLLNTDLQEET